MCRVTFQYMCRKTGSYNSGMTQETWYVGFSIFLPLLGPTFSTKILYASVSIFRPLDGLGRFLYPSDAIVFYINDPLLKCEWKWSNPHKLCNNIG